MAVKQILKVLEIDRSVKDGEHAVDIFKKHMYAYDLLLFPPKENDPECRIQCISARDEYQMDFQKIFSVVIESDDDAPFYDFDVTQITQDVFYDVLDILFDIELTQLTKIERK